MKFILLVAVTLASSALVSGAATASSEERVSKSEYIAKYLNESGLYDKTAKQLNEWCAGSADKLVDAIRALEECDDAISDDITTCESIRVHGLKCMRPIIKAISECFPEGSKDIPELLAKSLISTADYICKQDGEHIFELFNTCAYEFALELKTETDRKVSECFQRQNKALEDFEDKFPTKTQVCNWAKDVKSCFTPHVNAACGNQKTKSAHLGLFNAILEPCNVVA